MLGLATKHESVDEAREQLTTIRGQYHAAKAAWEKAEAAFSHAHSVSEGKIDAGDAEVARAKGQLEPLRQRAWEAKAVLMVIEPGLRPAEEQVRVAVDAARRPGLKKLVWKMFKAAEEAEQAARELRRYEEETHTLDGSRADEAHCGPLLDGFASHRQKAREIGLLD
jgi:chromosome segregation ATPase